MDTEKQRQRRRDNARLTKSGNARSEQLLVVPSAYRVANQQRMAARRALEWIGASKPGWFLDMKYQLDLLLNGMGLRMGNDISLYFLALVIMDIYKTN